MSSLGSNRSVTKDIVFFVIVVAILLYIAANIPISKVEDQLLVEELSTLQQQYDYQTQILSLSMRFHIDPSIVAIVDAASRRIWGTISANSYRWDFIRSPDELTRRMLSIIWVESKGDSTAIGDRGRAVGLSQLWLSTAMIYDPEVSTADLHDPVIHINLMYSHFLDLLDKNDGDDVLSYLAWNYGQRGALDLIASRRATNGYAMQILRAGLQPAS
jgi:hypothetical protein